MWTPRPLYGWQNEVSGWLLHCVQAELCHLHELQDEALEERMVPEEHRLPRATGYRPWQHPGGAKEEGLSRSGRRQGGSCSFMVRRRSEQSKAGQRRRGGGMRGGSAGQNEARDVESFAPKIMVDKGEIVSLHVGERM